MTSIRDFDRSALDASLNDVMDALANSEFGGISVKSGARSKVGNLLAGGAKKSQHLSGKALDIDISGLTNQQKATLLGIAVAHGIKGVGIYKSGKSLHIDTRATPTTWGPSKRGAYKGVDPSAQPSWAQPALKSMFSGSFPPAPSGPTPLERGPGIYGARSPVEVAQLARQYSLANTRYRQPVAATPLDQFRPAPAATPPSAIAQTPVAFGNVPMASGMIDATPIGPQSRAVLGAGAPTPGMIGEPYAEAAVPQAAPTQARVSTPAAPAMNISPTASLASQFASPSEALRVGAPSAPSLAPSAPFSPVGPYATAAVPAAPAPAVTAPSAYPDEGRFSMKKGLTPEDSKQMGLVPAQPAPVDVPTQKVAAVQPTETVITAPPAVKTTTVTAPTIAPAAPPLAKPGGLLANIAGPVPNPKSFDYGTGAQAIGDALSGATQSKPGAVSYSKSTPGYSIKSLGNGMVEKTNQYGHKSYERVGTPGSGILSGQPTTGGLLSNFGMPGLGATAGGLLSGKNLGGFAGSLLGGAIAGPFGALAGGWLGNKFGSNLGGTGFGNTANVGPNAFGYAGPWGAGTAPASSGGLFGGFGGFGGGGSTSTGGGKRGGTSSGGRGSMSAGSGGMSKSTRY